MKLIASPMSQGQGNEFLNKLKAAGLDSKIAKKVIESKGNDLAVKVVEFIQNGGLMNRERARICVDLLLSDPHSPLPLG
jgi:hypothetical protein